MSQPENSSANFETAIKAGSESGIPIDVILKGMSNDDIHAFLMDHYEKLLKQCKDLTEQYKDVASTLDKNNKDVLDRIDHILSLMTSHMMYIKQMIQIEESSAQRLDDQEKLNARQELQFVSLVDRQNRFSQSVENMNSNTKEILKEIAYLRAKEVDNDKFKSRIILIGTIGSAILYWLMSGNNFSKMLVMLQDFTK